MKHSISKVLRKLWPLLLALLLIGFTALADVRLPEQLTVIEAEAFLNDTQLTGPLVIPPSVRIIGPRAFEGCIGLTGTLVIPEGVTTIDSRAFANCTGLSGEVYIPASVTYLAEDAFDGTDVTLRFASISTDTDLPGDGSSSGGNTSGGNNVITMTDLPEGIAYEMTEAGAVITAYTGESEAELAIPATISGIPVVAIGDGAFQDCYGLTGSIVIPGSVTRIGANAFFGCSGLDGTLVIPASVTEIGDFAFYECLSLSGSLSLPSSVQSVGESAFAFCESMTGSLTLPAGAYLGPRCFQASGFTGSITIPATMTLGANAFIGTALDITWEAPGFTYEQSGSIVTITGWNGPLDGGLTIPGSINGCTVSGIAAEAFADVGLRGTVTIPGSVVFIGESAFRSNPGVTAVTFAEGLSTISEYAFADCTGLTGVITLPATVTALDDTAFSGCDANIVIAQPGN